MLWDSLRCWRRRGCDWRLGGGLERLRRRRLDLDDGLADDRRFRGWRSGERLDDGRLSHWCCRTLGHHLFRWHLFRWRRLLGLDLANETLCGGLSTDAVSLRVFDRRRMTFDTDPKRNGEV